MDNQLELHCLLHRKDIQLFIDTYRLFKFYSNLEFKTVVHDDGSFDSTDIAVLTQTIPNSVVLRRKEVEDSIRERLKNHPLCTHFRFAEHHTIFKVKLFDPFILSETGNVLNLDSDILFCKKPVELISNIQNSQGCYLRDSWSAYCVPFRDEDKDVSIKRFINAGLTYFPTYKHFNLDYIEECLDILYSHGSRGATHPFLEQTCIAYLISKQGSMFEQLSHPEYCVPTFGKFLPEHNLTALHINSSPLVGRFRKEHYEYELKKIEELG